MSKSNFETLEDYQLSEKLSDQIWFLVIEWDHFSKHSIGHQMIRAADSIGADIAEGTGRATIQDNKRFVRIARASLYETKHWLKRASKRKLLTHQQIHDLAPIINELAPRLNAYLNSIGR